MNRVLTTCTLLALSMAAVTAAVAKADPAPLPLAVPFAEDFASAALNPSWVAHFGKESAVNFTGGAMEMRVRANARAHIERPLGVDSVRVCVGLKAGAAESPAMVLLRWDESNFIQFGLNHPASGQLNVREVLGTYPHDHELGLTVPGEWQTLAIELARDCIRYFASADGHLFKCVHISRRPERFAGAPKLLGLGQDFGGKLFARPSPWIVAPPADNLVEIAFRNLRVTALSAKASRASAAERKTLTERERDLLGEQELNSRSDPSFDSVGRHLPALKWSREIVGVKDHPFDVGVAADGSLQLSDNIANYKKPTAFFKADGRRFGSGASGCTKRLLNGWMPVVISAEQHDGLKLEQTVFGYSRDFSPDEPLFGYVQLRAENYWDSPRSTRLEFVLEAGTNRPSSLTWQLDLPAHGGKSIAVRVPYKITELTAAEILPADFETRLSDVTVYWDKLIAQGSRFEIPEPRVQNAYRAWIAYNFLNVSKRKGVFHVCDGSGFYNEVYGYSAALFCNNLDLLGYHDLAAGYFDSLLTFVQTNGLLAVNFGDTDTGVALWSMSEHYRITRDAEWLRRRAPKMIQMCNWIIDQRRAVLANAPKEPVVTRGLIRYRPYADLLHPAADYLSNGYLCKGLAATAGVFAEIGLNEEAARLKREAGAYLQDLRASMDQAVFEDRGMKVLPVIPDTRELWKESDGSANGYYGIIAPLLLEIGIPSPKDPAADLLVRVLRQRGGFVLGVPQFHDMADHAYGYGYWMTCLDWNEPGRVILGLYASLAYGMSRETYSAVECTMIQTGENYWTLPHTYSNTQQLRLLRNMIVHEVGDELCLGAAIPRDWLAPGKHVAVMDAPTLFGPVSCRILAEADSVRVKLDPPMRNPPKEISICLRNPGHRRIAHVTADRPAEIKFADETVRLRGVGSPIALEVTLR